MFKKILSFLAAAALTCAPLTAFAAESPTNTGSGIVGTPTITNLSEGTHLEYSCFDSKDSEINKTLQTASDELKAKNASAVAAITEAAKGLNVDVNHWTVADLFDLSVVNSGTGKKAEWNGTFTVRVKTNVTENQPFVVIHRNADGTWNPVTASYVGNGVIEITYTGSLSPFAVITFGAKTTGTTGGTSTNGNVSTAANSNMVWAVAGVAAGLAGVLFLIKARKNLAD